MLAVSCEDMGFLIRILAKLVYYLRIIIPILLIILIVFDLFKVMVGNADDKAKSEAINKAVKRFLYAVIIFLIPVLVNLIFKQVGEYAPDDNNINTTPTSWVSCWTYYYNK